MNILAYSSIFNIILCMENKNLVIQNVNGEMRYCRTVGNELNVLADKLKKSYDCKQRKAFPLILPSGTAAMSVAISTCVNKYKPFQINDSLPNIIYGNELYCDTIRTIKFINYDEQCEIYPINVNDTVHTIELFNKMKDQHNILVLESCSNPSGYIFDWSIIPHLCKLSKTLTVVIDNTWLTHYIFNPLEYYADIVVLSLTKYYSAGNHIGGALIATSRKVLGNLYYCIKVFGLHTSPFACDIISKNMDTLEERIIKTSDITKQVVEFMINHNMIFRHPLIHSKEKNQKYFKNELVPGVISFELNTSPEKIKDFVQKLNIKFETSYGSAYSRICNHLVKKSDNVTKIRLSIGYDDTYKRLHDEVLEPFIKELNL